LATLHLIDRSDPYPGILSMAERLADGLGAVFGEAGIPAQIARSGSLFSLFFTDGPVRDYREAKAADHGRYARFFHRMLEEGIYLPPSGYEAWFVSAAHGEDEVSRALHAAERAAAAIG